MKKRLAAVFLALAMVISLAACSSSSSSSDTSSSDASADTASTDTGTAESDFDGSLVVGISDSLGSFQKGADAGDCYTGQYLVFDMIFYTGTDGEVYSDILEDWYYEDELTMVLKLKEGVYFNNGEEATAEDVIFSFTNYAERGAMTASIFAGVDADNSYAEDDYTAVIKFTEEWGPGLDAVDAPLFCKSWCEEVGWDSEDWLNCPVGSGPYEVVEYVTDSYVTLTLRDDYWGDDTMYNSAITDITIQYYSTISTLYVDLQTGAVDLALNIAEADYARASDGSEEGITVERISTNEVEFLCLDTNNEYLSDANIRLAIAYGVDWSVVADAGFGSLWDSADSLLNSRSAYYVSAGSYEYDYDKAMEYIDASGIDPSTVEFTFVAMADDDQQNMAEAFQYYMSELGFTVNLEFYDFSTALMTWLEEGGTAFNFQESATGSPSGEPYISLNALMTKYGSFPICTVDDDYFNELAEAAISCIDEDERTELFAELQAYNYENAFAIPMLEGYYAIGYDNTVISSVDFTSAISANLREITLVQ